MAIVVEGGDRGPALTLVGHEGAVLCLRFNETGTYLVSGGKDRSVRLWNPRRGTLIKTYQGAHAHEVRGVAVSQANDRIASCGGDRQVFLHDVSTGRVLRRFKGHDTKDVNAISFARETKDSVLFSGGYDATLRAWDCRSSSAEAIQVLRSFKDSVTSVATCGHEVIAGSVDGAVRSFDVRTGRVITDTLHPPVTSVSLSSDSQCVLVGVLDDKIGLLDRSSGDLLAQYKGHSNSKFKLDSVLTHDDAYVISGSEDGRCFLWDLVESTVAQSFQANEVGTALAALAWQPEGDCLVTGAARGDIRVWKGCG